MRELTKDTVRQLISEILVYDRKRVEIHFKFKDEWEAKSVKRQDDETKYRIKCEIKGAVGK